MMLWPLDHQGLLILLAILLLGPLGITGLTLFIVGLVTTRPRLWRAGLVMMIAEGAIMALAVIVALLARR